MVTTLPPSPSPPTSTAISHFLHLSDYNLHNAKGKLDNISAGRDKMRHFPSDFHCLSLLLLWGREEVGGKGEEGEKYKVVNE